MKPYYQDDRATVLHGDCLALMAEMPDASFDAVVTDPPYGLGFMGKAWDDLPPGVEWAQECLRLLKPGGHLLAFGGSRTWHRLATAVEDAGFEIRDSIAWLYGSGFPKSLDVSKAIDKRREEDRAPVDAVRSWLNARRLDAGLTHDAVNKHFGHASNGGGSSSAWMTNPTSRSLPTWDQWQELKSLFGFGDDMDAEVWRLNGRKGKPGDNYEAREVLSTRQVADIRNGHGREYGGAMFAGEDTGKITHRTTAPATPDAERWQGWGTALKPAFEPVVVARKPLAGTVAQNVLTHGTGALNIDGCRVEAKPGDYDHPGNDNHTPTRDLYEGGWDDNGRQRPPHPAGRWPANVVLDESQAEALDGQSGPSGEPPRTGTRSGKAPGVLGAFTGQDEARKAIGDTGGASRFFYVAKAPQSERPKVGGIAHPTVKPLALMQWLIRLVAPPGGHILEPFAGSGTTVEAALRERVRVTAIEREADYLPLILQRIERHEDAPDEPPTLFDDMEASA